VSGNRAEPATLSQLQRGVVGLVVSYQDHDADRPWVKRRPATRNAQAAVMPGGYLLTSAQMVSGATLVEVEREGRPPRALARVFHVDRESNLALLVVDAPGFVDDLEPLAFAGSTPTSGDLRAIRWYQQQFELAELRIKRIAVSEAWFGRCRHAYLLGRSDLADGGWAEPVVDDDGALVGLATGQNEHTVWVVPVELLAAYYARATAPGPYLPFPTVRFSWQWTMDRALAAWLGLGNAPRGVMIRSVPRGTTGDGSLRPRDVLLALDGHAIDSRGYYQHPRWGWVEFSQLVVEGHRSGDVVPARILRDGVEREVSVVLRDSPTALDLVPVRRGDDPPPYVIVGGLVFVELDGEYLRAWGKDWTSRAPLRLVGASQLLEGAQDTGRRRLVVLSQLLPSPWSVGYEGLRDHVVEAIDGRAIGSLADVVDAFAAPPGPFVHVAFAPSGERSELVVATAGLAETTAQILRDYGIPAAVRLPARPLPPLD
jgi:S1-C subfamily serine protease